MSVFLKAFLLLFLSVELECAVVYHRFEISYGTGSPDGVSKTSILKINGQFPGPTIEANLGDTLQIDVVNLIQDGQNTSLHWHGLHQRDGNVFQDGPNMITQCPLKKGSAQRYQFTLGQHGTFWYHGHVRSQYSEGLWGLLIIKNPQEVHQYDGEFNLALSDWYHPTAKVNEEWYLSPKSRDAGPPLPDSLLINGMGKYPCPIAWQKSLVCLANRQLRPVIRLPVGGTYRLRLINTGSRVTFNFSVDGHSLQPIEMDGEDLVPSADVDVALIAPGQRYSFLVRTRVGSTKQDYMMRAVALQASLEPYNDLNINKFRDSMFKEVTAVLRYTPPGSGVRVGSESHSHRAPVPSRPLIQGQRVLDELQLLPLDGESAPPDSVVTHKFVVSSGLIRDGMDVTHVAFNMTPFVIPSDKPILHSVIDNAPLPQGFPYLKVEYLSVVQLVINNFLGAHPFHLHGHFFWIVGKGRMRSDGSPEGLLPFDEGIEGSQLNRNGPKRDTMFLHEGEWGVIRFIADNPGVWSFHCHIDWHNLGGMGFVFLEGEEETRFRYQGLLDADKRRLCS